MPRISRVVLPYHLHHITQRGVRSQEIFFSDEDRRLYLDLMRAQTQKHGVKVLCYCLMSNHVHLLAIPNSPESLARAIGEAHRRYTLHINQRTKTRGYLFQGRFASCPLDGDHALAAARYVLLNPVRAGLVQTAIEWQWSSAALHAGLCADDPLVKPNDLLGHCPDLRSWRQLLESDHEERHNRLREATRTGRPCGDEEFEQRAEHITQRALRRQPPGRPRREKKE